MKEKSIKTVHIPDHTQNRNKMVLVLRRELMGPACAGKPIDCRSEIICDDSKMFYGPSVQEGTREEIVKGETPRGRYGVGVLYPIAYFSRPQEDDNEESKTDVEGEAEKVVSKDFRKKLERATDRIAGDNSEKDSDDYSISLANSSRPPSMGISFLADLQKGGSIFVVVKGGRYRMKQAKLADVGKTSNWYLRSPVKITSIFSAEDILDMSGIVKSKQPPIQRNCEGLDIRIELVSRRDPSIVGGDSGRRLITICVINRTASQGENSLDEKCLFQSRFQARILSENKSSCIIPYPEAGLRMPDEEEQSLMVLYRNNQTYATGHGCAADWEKNEGEPNVKMVKAVPFPVFETPSITPEILRKDGTEVIVPMGPLAGLDKDNDGMDSLLEVIKLYGDWLSEREKEATGLPSNLSDAAGRHLDLCRRCHERMKDGLKYLRKNGKAAMAFQLANHAMLLQQLRSFRESRIKQWDDTKKRLYFPEPFIAPDPKNPGKERGRWRPFQIAFLLMSMRSAAEGNVPDPVYRELNNRETVELIWFPTGGGKTEAYLGLAAFSLFMRRLIDRDDDGTHVLMRYTLRLLTAQQFQRASGLICAMEYLRRENEDILGTSEYSIGIWVGGATTPNTRKNALKEYRDLLSSSRDSEYHFIILRCPWCGAKIGPFETGMAARAKRKSKNKKFFEGLDQIDETVILHCSDGKCQFGRKLPIYVIDEDIYDNPPSLLIGTVDKFASLAWKPEARSIFGIDPDGKRVLSPPGLIIQDELHLITGPLGSMTGLYETVVEELCTDYREPSKPVPPKIISSTATIRRYREQVRGLYARSDTILFPPPGLDAGDSFFSSYAREKDGTLKRGRLYVGVHASGFGSVLTTNVRVFSSLLQGCQRFDDAAKDPWATLMVFCNSLRELGANLTLFQSDVPERIFKLSRQDGKYLMRYLNNIKELTGRISSSEIPEALQELERIPGKDKYPVDVCLASNIIEVGIDVDRLSMMVIAGQPKTTSQYIQVSGRVGRKWWERPGMVVTLYSPGKSRDRSHFERFRSYHERLYAQVEPSSVTPFTPPALKRALHAVITAYVRQFGGREESESPTPFPDEIISRISTILETRVKFVDVREKKNMINELRDRIAEWKVWNHSEWHATSNSENPSLLRYTGTYYPEIWKGKSWATPTSMRSVDAECMPEITQLYLRDNIEEMRSSG